MAGKDEVFMMSLIDRMFKSIEKLEKTTEKQHEMNTEKLDDLINTFKEKFAEAIQTFKENFSESIDASTEALDSKKDVNCEVIRVQNFVIKALMIIIFCLLIALGIINHQQIIEIITAIKGAL